MHECKLATLHDERYKGKYKDDAVLLHVFMFAFLFLDVKKLERKFDLFESFLSQSQKGFSFKRDFHSTTS